MLKLRHLKTLHDTFAARQSPFVRILKSNKEFGFMQVKNVLLTEVCQWKSNYSERLEKLAKGHTKA